MDEQQRAEQTTRLARLASVPADKFFTVGMSKYLSISTVSAVLGKAKSTVSKWCNTKKVFRRVIQTPEYNGIYLIPLDEIERVIKEDDLPQPGNPNWIAAGAANPNPYPYKKRNRRKKGNEGQPHKGKGKAANGNGKKTRASRQRQIAQTV